MTKEPISKKTMKNIKTGLKQIKEGKGLTKEQVFGKDKEQEIGKKIKGLVDDFYKTPIGELPKEHFWIDRNSHLYCGQFHTNIKVDITEALSLIQKEHEKELELELEIHKSSTYFQEKLKALKEVDELEDELVMTKGIKDNYGQNMNAWRKKSMGQHHYIKNLKQQLQKCEKEKEEIFKEIDKRIKFCKKEFGETSEIDFLEQLKQKHTSPKDKKNEN